MTAPAVQLNGSPATVDQLAPVAFAGYAHFTALQVRHGAVRGLDLHLARLRRASDELFGTHSPDDQVRDYLRRAIRAGPEDASLSCFVTQRDGEFAAPGTAAPLDVFVRSAAPATPPSGPLGLDVVHHERHLAHLKHVGEVGKIFHLRRALARGFDDAVFVDARGRLSEATIWNLALWDGVSVVWPHADLLPGVTMQIVTRGLAARGVPQRTAVVHLADLGAYRAGALMNSWTPGVPVDRIGDHLLVRDELFTGLLHDVYADEPLVAV
jgi:branched-subunit amino acid aminotransferase/4-amino-4-deoxychorismate lyase